MFTSVFLVDAQMGFPVTLGVIQKMEKLFFLK